MRSTSQITFALISSSFCIRTQQKGSSLMDMITRREVFLFIMKRISSFFAAAASSSSSVLLLIIYVDKNSMNEKQEKLAFS
jgi:uncharacterized membrane protein